MCNQSACRCEAWAGALLHPPRLTQAVQGLPGWHSHTTASTPGSLLQAGNLPTLFLWTQRCWGSGWWCGVCTSGVGYVPSWGFVWDPTEAPQDVGSSNAPPLTPQHCTESKMPSLLHRADSLSVLGAELNIYLLLHHPQITLLWGVVIKPLMQYSGSLTAYEDRLKERGQNQIFDCMMSAPEEKCNNQKISTLRNSLLVNKSHADGTN